MPPTLIDLDGFNHRFAAVNQAGSGFSGFYSGVGRPAGVTFDTSIKRLAAHAASLMVVEDGVAQTSVVRNIAAGKRLLVASFYFRVVAAPGVSSRLFSLGGPTNNFLARMATNGALQLGFTNGTFQATAGSLADSAWHRLDVRVDVSTATFTVDWQVDGVAQTQATKGSETPADMSSWRLGSTANGDNLTIRYQDFVLSETTGDYPIGDHVVLPLYPVAEGTDALGTTNPIVDEAGGNANLFQKVDDWNGGTPNTTDYLTYTSITLGDAASNFAEFVMGDPPAGSEVWDVAGYIAGFAATTTTCSADTQVLTFHGGTLIDHIGDQIDYSGSATVLGALKQVLARPSGGWSEAGLSAVVVQWGRSTDVNPGPRLSAVMLEYAARRAATLGQATATNTAQPVGRTKSKTIGQSSESDTAQAVTATRNRNVSAGQATEADLAQAVARTKQKAIGQAPATNTAQPVSTRRAVAIGQTSETDPAQPITPRRSVAVGQASETGAAQAIGESRSRGAGQGTESDLAQAIGASRSKVIGQALETDEAFPISRGATAAFIDVGQALETDSPQATSSSKRKTIGQAAEASTVGAISRRKSRTLVQLAETNIARAIRAGHAATLARGSETGTASAVTSRHTRAIGRASETDAPGAIGAQTSKAIGQAGELDSTGAVGPHHSGIVGPALETSTSVAMGRSKRRTIGRAEEIDEARPLHRRGRTMALGDPNEAWEAELVGAWDAGAPSGGWDTG